MDLTLRLFTPSNGFPDLNQSIVDSCDAGVSNEQLQCHNSITGSIVSSSRDPRYAIDLNTCPDNNDHPASHIVSNSSIGFSKTLNSVTDGFSSNSQVVWDFSKGVSKSLPDGSKELGVNGVFSVQNKKPGGEKAENKEPKAGDERKSSEVCLESSEEFDDVPYAIEKREEELAAYMASLQISVGKSVGKEAEGSSGAKEKTSNKTKKKKKKEQPIDLNAILITCAEFIANGNLSKAKEMLGKIRQHSSPCGDGGQRLAHYFADGLEARLAGPSSETYKSLACEGAPRGPSDYLKAHCMSVVFSPFRRVLNFASNNMIAIRSRKTTRIHIIDFGICYDFQWPILIRRVAARDGGPPALRITGVDFPLPGPRPKERVEEMGRRLAQCAEAYGVPFEYKPIASAWEDIKLVDLELRMGEFVVVNVSERAKALPDEMNAVEKSRATVLNLIRDANPDIFIQGVVHSAHGSSFFVPRFREALYHYSVVFDMLEKAVPGDGPERMVVERDVIGKEIFNVVACEGWERVERPETYKQWHGRLVRAGLAPIPPERGLMAALLQKVRNFHQREHVIVEENRWLLMSWKGRTIYGLSFWRPAV